RVRDERQRPVRGTRQVEGGVAEGQGGRVGLDEGEVPADAEGVLELTVGEVESHRPRTLAGQPARTLGRAGPDLQDVLALEVLRRAEQLGLDLVEALRAPDEAVVAEEGAVLDLVLVRVPVPPAPVGPGTLRDTGGTPSGFWLELLGLLDDRLPRRTLPTNPL